MHRRCNELMVYRCLYWSVYLSIRSQLENNAAQICLNGFSWYLDTMIIRWGTIGGVQEFGVKGHLGIIWGSLFKYAQNASSSIWFNRLWWNLGEEILGQRFFRVVQEFLIGGHPGVIWGICWRSNFKQPSTTNLNMSLCWSRSTIKNS